MPRQLIEAAERIKLEREEELKEEEAEVQAALLLLQAAVSSS